MNFLFAAFLGIIQGLTEFLPVSSSGHLVIAQKLIPSFTQPGILFDVILHFGTLFSVLFFFRKKLLSYLNIKYLTLLALGTLPAVVVGLLFKSQIETLFNSVRVVGYALLLTGTMNLLTDKIKSKDQRLTTKNSFLVGLAQAVAIIPGISRSGSTIFAGVVQGIDKKKAAEFSFILSIPAILGANILEIFSHGLGGNFEPLAYFSGFVVSALVGYFSIKVVFSAISSKKFKYFGIYCILLGTIILLLI